MRDAVIVMAKRTPIGKIGGQFSTIGARKTTSTINQGYFTRNKGPKALSLMM